MKRQFSIISFISAIIPGVHKSLSAQLLVLTIIVVLVTEIVIMIPSVAHQQNSLLRARTEAAYLVGLALEDLETPIVDDMMVDKILMSAGIEGVTLRTSNGPTQILAPNVIGLGPEDIHTIDLHNYGLVAMIIDAWTTVTGGGEALIRVVGGTHLRSSRIQDIILSRADLRKNLLIYARNILILSLLISVITAVCVYISLDNLILKPVRNMRQNMSAFEANPESPEAVLHPSDRVDEIGDAERGLSTLEHKLQSLLNERRRLAALGAGISKISHDLRNILASAQLMSDRLVTSDDPRVRKLSPRLVDALDRAITLSRETLNYGSISPEILNRETVDLHALVDNIFDDTASVHITMTNGVPDDLKINIDRTQFHRGLSNIIRNSVEALLPEGADQISADDFTVGDSAEGNAEGGKADKTGGDKADKTITVTADQRAGIITIDVADTGPGLPDSAREFLYEPFKGSYKPGGSGLGIAITGEIMRAHGGALVLQKSDATGATFRITLPV